MLRYLPLLALFSHSLVFADPASRINEQIAMTREIKEIALSPDGATVVSTITDTTAAGGRTHLWTMQKAGAPRQITGLGDDRSANDSSPLWTADGRAILFVRKKDDTSTINKVDVSSGRIEGVPLVRAGRPVSVRGFTVSASGTLAIWGAAGHRDPDKEARKDDHRVFGQSEPVHLYLIETSGPPREIAVSGNVRSVTFDKDPRRLLVITAPASDDLGAQNRLWLIENAAQPREITRTAENVQAASWLADGRIAYFARCARDAPIVCRDLFVQALDGSKPTLLTDGIDGSLMIEGAATSGPLVTRSGDIVVTIARRFDQQLARIRPDGRITYINALPAVVKSVTTNNHQSAFALLAADRGAEISVRLTDARLRSPERLASPELQPAEWQPLNARRIEWASEGHKIDGLLYLPSRATADPRVPLIVDVHGGPAGRFEDIDYPLVRMLLEAGWAVLRVNPRGSFGYGVEFLASLKDDLGGVDYRDIMTGVDAALAQAPLDAGRLALIGYSYGGTIVSFALGRTDRFKALVAVAPVVNQMSEYGTESSSWYDRWYFGKPWSRLEAAWRQSPLAGVASARTPLLLLHGENDAVNPLGQSLELHRALRQEGSPVELILFPRETHHEIGQNFYGYPSVEPRHGIVLRQRLLDFLRAAFSGQPHAGLAMGDSQ